jgi:murein L,D-transpeptidase YafK
VPYFQAAGIPYPPERFVLLGLKRERELQLYASGGGRPLAFVRSYAIRAASGALGPKLRWGDRQVREGVYTIESLNPNSDFHLSLRLDYPNDYDRARADEDGRRDLGGDIMIHGGAVSVGCLAVGDEAIEELFVLAFDAGWEDALVVLSPVDFRIGELPVDYAPPTAWTPALYATLREEIAKLPVAFAR